MRIIDAVWAPECNMYIIQCDCGNEFQHHSDRWKITCPFCYKKGDSGRLRDEIKPGQLRGSANGQSTPEVSQGNGTEKEHGEVL